MASADSGGKCRSATEGGPRTARPCLPVSLQLNAKPVSLFRSLRRARRPTNPMPQRPPPLLVRRADTGHESMTTSALFPFDVAARDCVRSYIFRYAGRARRSFDRSALVVPEGVGVGAPPVPLLL